MKGYLFSEYPFYPCADKDKILKYCQSLPSVEARIDYLEFVLKERKNDLEDKTDPNNEMINTLEDFFQHSEWLKREIRYWKGILNRRNRKLKEQQSRQESQEQRANQKPVEKIQWQGTEAQLVYLFEKLYEKRLLPKAVNDKQFAFIEKHFINNKGQAFKRKQLAQASQNYQNNKEGKPKGAKLIDKLTEEIEPHTRV